jgi:hypothetical protein
MTEIIFSSQSVNIQMEKKNSSLKSENLNDKNSQYARRAQSINFQRARQEKRVSRACGHALKSGLVVGYAQF